MNSHLPEHLYFLGEQKAELAAAQLPEKKAPRYTFSVESVIAVVGQHPEFSDMDNPEGYIHGERFFMVATTPEGRCYSYGWETSAAKAEMAFEHLAPPVSEWQHWRNVYGSKAYEEDGDEVDQLCSEMEEDLGPNWRSTAAGRY